jgi:serine/threonine protein kinase
MVAAIEKFGRYEIVRKLGRSMTDVYLAHDPETRRPVVLKIVEHSRDEFTRLVIEAETRGAQIQKQLHRLDPRILEIYESGERDGCFFVAMEYFKGRTLAEVLASEGRLAPARAALYAAETCNQLRTLHGFVSDVDGRLTAVVHGDIKPSNIQISASDELKLLDFGIAKVITSTHNLTRHNLGSPSYCSPERLSRAEVDSHADLWALGVSLYEMLAGAPPYQAQDTRKLEHLIQLRRAPRILPESCPPELRAIVNKSLAGDLHRRYSSAEAFESDLRAFLAGRPTVAGSEREPFWDANATVQTASPPSPQPAPAAPSAYTRPAASPGKLATPAPQAYSRANVAIALLAGILAGLILFIPAAYYLRLRRESNSLIRSKNYAHLPEQTLTSDWQTFQDLQRRKLSLGSIPSLPPFATGFRRNLLLSADSVAADFRNSSDSNLKDFDWKRGRRCLLLALQLEPNDRRARGELHLFDGYLQLATDPQGPKLTSTIAEFRRAAALAPASPDPHLALARAFIYGLHNVGAAMGEFHQAEQLGLHLGPREREEQGDGFLFRAQWDLSRARRASGSSRSDAAHWIELAGADLDRARNTFEPIAGFDDVAGRLEKVYSASDEQAQIRDALLHPPAPPAAKPKAKPVKTHSKKHASTHRWR